MLDSRTSTVAKAADPQAEIDRLWGLQDNNAFREVRQTLRTMASGIERCMYCEDSAGTAIDHFWPKADYPSRAFDWTNYLLACSICNSNFKRDQFPLDGQGLPLLLNPTEEDPLDHLAFSPTTGKLTSRSPKGDHSIRVFGLSREALEKGRAVAWTTLEVLIIRYAQDLEAGDAPHAARIEEAVKRHPFAGVLAALIRFVARPDAPLLVHARCLAAIHQHPEILTWS